MDVNERELFKASVVGYVKEFGYESFLNLIVEAFAEESMRWTGLEKKVKATRDKQ